MESRLMRRRYQRGDGSWGRFGMSSSRVAEEAWQAWRAGDGPGQVQYISAGRVRQQEVELDLQVMTQSNLGSGKQRAVRRVEATAFKLPPFFILSALREKWKSASETVGTSRNERMQSDSVRGMHCSASDPKPAPPTPTHHRLPTVLGTLVPPRPIVALCHIRCHSHQVGQMGNPFEQKMARVGRVTLSH